MNVRDLRHPAVAVSTFGSLLILVLLIASVLQGCCTYHGKAVSKREAARMKALGMDVQCGD